MTNQIKKLIEVLEKSDIELDAIQLAEVLWLAEHIKIVKEVEVEIEVESLKISLLNRLMTWLERLLKKYFTSNEIVIIPTEKIVTIETETTDNKASLSLPKTTQDKDNNHYISPHKNRDIFITDKLIKSFFGLKKNIISTKRELLCEDKTIDFIAKTGIISPIFKGKKENSFELLLIIDDNSSMEIWKESVKDFEKKLRAYKVFNSITMLYLDTLTTTVKIYHDKAHKTECKLNFFNNLKKRRLNFLLTDMVGLGWRSTSGLSLIYEIQKNIPTILINFLPYRMWNGTILKNTNITNLSASHPYSNNKNLKSELDRKLLKLDKNYFKYNPILKLPIINLRREDFIGVSQLIRAKENNCVSGIVVNINTVKKQETDSIKELTPLQIIDNYRNNSSVTAIELAYTMSVVKQLNMTIMQIIQKTILPQSTQTHLAEFFTGGLLYKSKEGEFYEFIEGVDELLSKELGNIKILQTLYQISDEIAKEIGSSLDFKALLNPHYEIDKTFDQSDRIFAFISPKILRRLGGKYAQIADIVTGVKKINKKVFLTNVNIDKWLEHNENSMKNGMLNYNFEIAKYPVSFEEYDLYCEELMIAKPYDQGWGRGKRPVINVSWHDANSYCKWLSKKTRKNYRLPTEIEWEYACSEGTGVGKWKKWHFGNDKNELRDYAWYNYNSNFKTHIIGEKTSNRWGMCDMYGNVWEWCGDNRNDFTTKILKGGSWLDDDNSTYISSSYERTPIARSHDIGFRLFRKL